MDHETEPRPEGSATTNGDAILQMWGVGKEIWADTNADDYVRSLRSNWNGSDPDVK